MDISEIGFVMSVAGLGAWLGFVQTARHMEVGGVARFFGPLSLPFAIASIVRIAIESGWWTILIFVLVSLFVGVVHAKLMRGEGRSAPFFLQGIYAVGGAVLVLGSWSLYFWPLASSV